MNTIFCPVDSIMSTSKMTCVLNEPQSNITQVEINPDCVNVICVTIILFVLIICGFIILMANNRQKRSIKTLLKNDKDIKDSIVKHMSADNEILKKTAIQIWKQHEQEFKDELVMKFKDDKEIKEYLDKKTKDQLRELILDAVKKEKNN